MLKTILLMVTLLSCVSANVALAQGKIAVVSIRQAILNTEAAQNRVNELQGQEDYKAIKSQLETIQKEGKEMAEKYQKDMDVLSDEQKMEMEKKMKSHREDFEHVGRKLVVAQQELAGQILNEMMAQAEKVIGELIKSEGIGLLMNKDLQLVKEREPLVFHVDSSYDITHKVTDKLNQLAAAEQPES